MRGDELPAVVLLRDVGGDRVRVELFGSRFDLLAPAGDEREAEALLSEHAGDGEADTGRPSGDERRLHDGRLYNLPPQQRPRVAPGYATAAARAAAAGERDVLLASEKFAAAAASPALR